MRQFPLRHTVVFCFLFVFVVLCGCAKQTDSDPVTSEGQVRARLGDFAVIASPTDMENMVVPTLRFKGKVLIETPDPVRELTAEQTQVAFPLPECRSMKVEIFTGGANCCFGYYLLTECQDEKFAAFIEPRDGGLGAAERKLRAYSADEAAFYYYEPAGQTGADKLSLSRSASPRLTRHIVFEDGFWRADKTGEFPAVYNALIRQATREKGMDPTAKAITVSYYTLMAGKSADRAFHVLKRFLPGKYVPLASQIFADIQKAAGGFNPVRNLTVEQ